MKNEDEPLNPDQIQAKEDAKLQEWLIPKKTPEKAPEKPVIEMEKVKPEPIQAEPNKPTPQQTTVEDADQVSQESRQRGTEFPITSFRPQAPKATHEEGSVIVAKALAEQLGTAPDIKAQMRIDERKLAVLTDPTLASLSHFSYRYVYDGVRYWGHITEWWLTGSQGIGGLGRRHILQAISSSSGVQSVEKEKKPNVLSRNLWNRDWKEKAESQGKIAEE